MPAGHNPAAFACPLLVSIDISRANGLIFGGGHTRACAPGVVAARGCGAVGASRSRCPSFLGLPLGFQLGPSTALSRRGRGRPRRRPARLSFGAGALALGRPRASVEEDWERLKELYDFKEPAGGRGRSRGSRSGQPPPSAAQASASSKYSPRDMQELANRDYTLIVDKSASMASPVAPNSSRSRWERVEGIFEEASPSGSTGLAAVLAHAADDYFARRDPRASGLVIAGLLIHAPGPRRQRGAAKANGELLIVVTDGEPDSKEDVYRAIVASAPRPALIINELRITFIQVGSDRRARAFLKVPQPQTRRIPKFEASILYFDFDQELDDEMEGRGAMFDIVDTKDPDEAEGLPLRQLLLEALFD
eukprot:tig00021038_g17528.t1